MSDDMDVKDSDLGKKEADGTLGSGWGPRSACHCSYSVALIGLEFNLILRDLPAKC